MAAPGTTTALLTDHYELTMLAGSLADGTSERDCVFELFSRGLPDGRRYGVVAGIGRLVEALSEFRFDEPDIAALAEAGVLGRRALDWLAEYRFSGDIEGYPEGELYFPGSPVLSVHSTFAEGVVLETLVLSILNHDSAIASGAARMASAANGRPLVEMGSRRTHEDAAVAAARAAYLAGFDTTSNLTAGLRYGIPTSGTSAHSFTLLHDTEEGAFRAQVAALGAGTTLLIDTYDISAGIDTAVRVAGTGLGAIRIDSGDLGVLARHAREQLDSLGARNTRIVVSGDLDEFAIAALRAEPVDAYGVGTSVVTGSGSPTAGMVYKLVEVDGHPVAKRSSHKRSRGGAKAALRRHKPTGTATEEIVYPPDRPPEPAPHDVVLTSPLVRGGEPVAERADLAESRERLRRALISVPWEGLKLSPGEPAVDTTFV